VLVEILFSTQKKIMKINRIFFSLVIGYLFISCNKTSDPTPQAPTATPFDLLTAHAWKYKAHVIDANNNGVLDEAIVLTRPCSQDDNWYLKADYTHQLIRGSVACNDPLEPKLDVNNSGSWQLLNNNTQLKYNETNNGDTLTGKIIVLNDTSFVFGIQTVRRSNLTPMEFDVYHK
jgi:Lipocalin-like domain